MLTIVDWRCFVSHGIRPLVWAATQRHVSTSGTLSGGRRTSEAPTQSKYSESVILPRTTFPLRLDGHKRTRTELNVQEAAEFESLYTWQRGQPREREFVLHDGPPYANGVPHIGHAVNKILKDITVRHKLLQGYKIHYVPGWDCHGLPIELKAAGMGGPVEGMNEKDPLQIRAAARKVVDEAIKGQREAFQRWGVLANWSNTYRTLDPSYVTRQLQLFAHLYHTDYIYQDFLPVYFSPNLGTSLAESELEYNPEHVSPAITAAFPATTIPSHLQERLASHRLHKLHLPVWTTTPWTLPSNQAVCYAPNQSYALALFSVPSGSNESRHKLVLVWAEQLLDQLRRIVGSQVEIVCLLQGKELAGVKYRHPLKECECELLPGDHVTVNSGTGLVHTAPAHGHEDYLVALTQHLPVECYVDGDGRFNAGAGEELKGKEVLKEGNQAVIDMLGKTEGGGGPSILLHQEDYTHSYPYDWRTGQPVIIRATRQWFLNTARVKEAALAALEEVKVLPGVGQREAAMINQVKKRPYWCISRQRTWGTPIPVFYDVHSGQPITNRHIVEHVAGVLEAEGSDAWWRLSDDKLLPPDLVKQMKEEGRPLPNKGKDTLDIWFDSGSSWYCVLGDRRADLYLEGLDQFNGWFLSSLLTSVAATGDAPYRCLYVHGFALDEAGHKMSKSLGNVVDPWIVTDGGTNTKKDPVYGADILRWWVASRASDNAASRIGARQLGEVQQAVQRVRAVVRYLLGCLSGGQYIPSFHSLPTTDLRPFDRYILHLLHGHVNQVWKDYDALCYNKVAQNSLNFINNTISALYFSCIKDRLYCEEKCGSKRMSALLVLHQLLHHLLLSLAPILPHMVEEAALHYNKVNNNNNNNKVQEWRVFHKVVEPPPPSWHHPELAAMMEVGLEVREELHRNATASATATDRLHATITAGGNTLQALYVLQTNTEATESGLCELLQVAGVSLLPHPGDADGFTLAVSEAEGEKCLRCRRFTAPGGADLCHRCQKVMTAQSP
ncbi:hypothetical protein Pcinc_030300 [Petrolisthes cinctipes]|uniref:isoleucine--tRNA ligase n=1 Tax=Petrolisthes cinctipes TaxID=88211 RepID=A0AAE1EZ32_PETCI|nr:hypothetical protein Pcinc_030300 [Petrolisthes cinctipes]